MLDDYEFEMVDNNCLLRRRSKRKKTEGGIFIPESAGGEELVADVLATGPGLRVHGKSDARQAPVVSEGDVVLVDRVGGIPIDVGGEQLLVARETEILAVLSRKS